MSTAKWQNIAGSNKFFTIKFIKWLRDELTTWISALDPQTWEIFKQINKFFLNKSKTVLIIFIIKKSWSTDTSQCCCYYFIWALISFNYLYDSTVSSYNLMGWIRNLKLCIKIDWIYKIKCQKFESVFNKWTFFLDKSK